MLIIWFWSQYVSIPLWWFHIRIKVTLLVIKYLFTLRTSAALLDISTGNPVVAQRVSKTGSVHVITSSCKVQTVSCLTCDSEWHCLTSVYLPFHSHLGHSVLILCLQGWVVKYLAIPHDPLTTKWLIFKVGYWLFRGTFYWSDHIL